MTFSKHTIWNQFAFSKSLTATAMMLAAISTFASTAGAMAENNAAPGTTTAAETAFPNALAPDVPPAVVTPTRMHEGSVVKTEIQAPIEAESKVENLMAPVPGNQDNSLPQPTFNALNTINTNISNGSNNASVATAATGSDTADASADDYSVTKNNLTYPMNDPVNGQFTGQSSPPLALRENSDSSAGATTVTQSKYQELPLSIDDAKSRLSQLRLMAAGTRPQDALENVNQFIKWLSDIVDAHAKMAGVFAKNETTKSLAASEKLMTTRFSHLRYQSQLLKADLLIEGHRSPEALAPLVEIVLAMPNNPLGKSAYQRLQELGFSSPDVVTRATTTTSGADNAPAVDEDKSKPEIEKTSVVPVAEPAKKIAMLATVTPAKKPVGAKKSGASKKTLKVTTRKSHKP